MVVLMFCWGGPSVKGWRGNSYNMLYEDFSTNQHMYKDWIHRSYTKPPTLSVLHRVVGAV